MTDELPAAPDLPHPPRRVVSLVPSLTESLFVLGLGETVVGVTDFCVRPVGAVDALPHVGGTKNPRVDEIVALQPDLVLANQEENTPETVEALQAAGVPVWVTFPRSVASALEHLRAVIGVFEKPQAAQLVRTLEVAVEYAEAVAADAPGRRYFCPIWQGGEGEGSAWWMTFNRDTYAHDVLRVAGGENVFAGRERRYPLAADLGEGSPAEAEGRDTRYPRVSADEVRAAAPEVILLPDEPFVFDAGHQERFEAAFEATPAVAAGRVYRVDGSLITWHGTRLARALQELPALFAGQFPGSGMGR